MITVHHLENSRSQRILWVLEELGVPYEVKRYERNKTTMLAPSELKVIHPLGKSPVITDGAITVAETGAIIEYLVETYGQGKLVPKTAADRRTWTVRARTGNRPSAGGPLRGRRGAPPERRARPGLRSTSPSAPAPRGRPRRGRLGT